MIRTYNKLIFEQSSKGRSSYRLPKLDVENIDLENIFDSSDLRTIPARLPEVYELDVVRHYTNLSYKNYSIDVGMYPLGSCTMKYNPKINEEIASNFSTLNLHPLVRDEDAQGILQLMYELQEQLKKISKMDAFTLQPAAGAHGELTGLMIIKAYHNSRGDTKRKRIIIPDAAHGTNPATVSMLGFEPIELRSNTVGKIDVEALRQLADYRVAGLMLTNPNTLGVFDQEVCEIADIIHRNGGLLYYDGANANAILGKTNPADMGFDVVHFNLHKTFSTPHGGGGPGSGPVGVKKFLEEFLPTPTIKFEDGMYKRDYSHQNSIGPIKDFFGHISILIRAYTYILSMGSDGLNQVSDMAVLNANYAYSKLKENYIKGFNVDFLHEFVLGGLKSNPLKSRTLEIAKRLIDYGFHPPTIYFPLIVNEAMMIEPTETESKENIDAFVKALNEIAQEATQQTNNFKEAPISTQISKPDEAFAARNPKLKYYE